jgi:phosphate acyltransferase
MAVPPHLAVDAMGGDEGVSNMLAGCALAIDANPELTLVLVGDQEMIAAELPKHPKLQARSEIVHAAGMIGGEGNLKDILRQAKTSSMGVAIEMVKSGRAQAAVSGGNTRALMPVGKSILKTIPGIDRPALAALLPTLGDNDVVMLDLGANTECQARNLVEFAVMGAAYARAGLGLGRPRVGLLNIGTEAEKGTDVIRDAALQLSSAKNLPIDFKGFVEGSHIQRGDFDVIVCDGFSGNIALKTIEGTARFVTDLLKRAFTSSIRSKFGYAISRPATELLKHHLDPNNHNGGVFLGLNGIVVKSHGSATEKGIAHAIGVASRLATNDMIHRISSDLVAISAKAKP